MPTKYVVACDGSSASGRAVKAAVEQAKLTGASLLLVHVLEWSPYSFLTPEEIEERHKRRSEELKRALKRPGNSPDDIDSINSEFQAKIEKKHAEVTHAPMEFHMDLKTTYNFL